MKKYTVTIHNSGTIRWYKEGTNIPHRENGPAIEYADGDKHWYKEGKVNREDGPAVECVNGDQYWYKEGKLHRENGPAYERANGRKEYWLNGERYSEAEFLKLTSKTPIDPCDGKEVIIEGKKYTLKLVDKA